MVFARKLLFSACLGRLHKVMVIKFSVRKITNTSKKWRNQGVFAQKLVLSACLDSLGKIIVANIWCLQSHEYKRKVVEFWLFQIEN